MPDWGLYVITDRHIAQSRPLSAIVEAAIAGGASAVQLREKVATTREMIELGHALHSITKAANIPLIVNDRVDVALAIDAEGVHVGQKDMPARLARQLLGPTKILGVSVTTPTEAHQAEVEGADYIGAGDIFGTLSKVDAGVPIGIHTLTAIVQAVSIPTVGIGGITAQNAIQVIRAGASGIAVISAVMGAANIEQTARQLRTIICSSGFAGGKLTIPHWNSKNELSWLYGSQT